MADVRTLCLPYCLKRLDNGCYVVLNRHYKPLGFKTTDWLAYEDYPIALQRRITARTAAALSYRGDPDTAMIYFYNDGCTPTASAKHMQAYLERLARFAKLQEHSHAA